MDKKAIDGCRWGVMVGSFVSMIGVVRRAGHALVEDDGNDLGQE
jgi:hypothetical protein